MKIYTAVIWMSALAVLAGAAAAQQDVQTPQMEQHETQMPMGRPEPAPQMMPETSQEPSPEVEEQGEGPFGVGQGRGMMCTCPMCQMGRARGQGRAMEMRMKQAGVPDETIVRARMLMKAKIHPADPQGLLALQNELSLTEDQTTRLETIIDSAQEQALGVLNAEQWEKVRQLRPRAASMMEMHRTIMPMMRVMRQAPGGMMGNMMPKEEQMPYGRPEAGGAQQEPSIGPMKPKCK